MDGLKTLMVDLPTGRFEMEYTPECEKAVRERYGIPEGDDVPPELVKLYLEQELRSAIEFIERSKTEGKLPDLKEEMPWVKK